MLVSLFIYFTDAEGITKRNAFPYIHNLLFQTTKSLESIYLQLQMVERCGLRELCHQLDFKIALESLLESGM